jgi:pyrroloquinoline quinone (PQQ) biosynthesis protein C
VFDRLRERFEPVLANFHRSSAISALREGAMTPAEYRSILRQIFHHTRENPQLQALATVYFRGRQRDMIRSFYAHAASEIGHDQLALNDFVTLGGDATDVPYENPLPATTALLAYGFYQIYNLNPLGYLGYLYFLEFMPTATGEGLMNSLSKIGVPRNAMSFLRDHTEIDVGHNKMMQKYVSGLVRSDADLDCVAYAMKSTGYLYSEMLAQAREDAQTNSEKGWNWEELNADGIAPRDVAKAVA